VGSGAAVAVVSKAYVRLGMRQPLSISTGAVSATFPELLKGITPDALIFPNLQNDGLRLATGERSEPRGDRDPP